MDLAWLKWCRFADLFIHCGSHIGPRLAQPERTHLPADFCIRFRTVPVIATYRPSDFPRQRKTDGIHGNGRLKRNSIPGVQCAPKRMISKTRMLNTLKLLLLFSPELAIAILEWPKVLRPQKKEDAQPLWLELQRKKE